jgi:RHS repeat-associated protein
VLGTFGYTYVANSGRLSSVTYPNGQTTAYTYFGHTGDDRLQTIHHRYPDESTLSKFDYTYNAVGNIVTWQQQADSNAPVVWTYGYDAADQLRAASKMTTDQPPSVLKRYVYTYDAAGNRTSEQIDDAVTGATYNNMNQLVSQQPAGGMPFAGTLSEPATVMIAGRPAAVNADNSFSGSAAIASGTNTVAIVATDASANSTTNEYQVESSGSTKTFTYDANGNLTSDGSRTFEWDAKNRLTAVVVGNQRTELTYDGSSKFTHVVDKDGAIIVTDRSFVWDGDRVLEERTAGSSSLKNYFKQGIVDGLTKTFATIDHIDSVRDLTDVLGAPTAHYSYDPFGRQNIDYGSGGFSIGYGGYFAGASSSLEFATYRAYDAELGRWISEDPLGLDAGLNPFEYVASNPIAVNDPSGLKPLYGNYCGKGSTPGAPKDELDAACKEHDDCYGALGLTGWSGAGGSGSKCKQKCDHKLCQAARYFRPKDSEGMRAKVVIRLLFCYQGY